MWLALACNWARMVWNIAVSGENLQPQEAAGGIPKGRGPKHEGQAPPEAPGNNGNIPQQQSSQQQEQ